MIELVATQLSARINPLGAELWSLTDSCGRELMTDADPCWWVGHAPVLFPFVGRLRHDRYRLGDTEFSMPPHGFARMQSFSLIHSDAESALLRLEANAQTRGAYPFDFCLDMVFSIEGATLHMAANVTNAGAQDMPFSFGFHPAFAWPLPFGGALGDHRIVFELPEPAPIRRVGHEAGLIALESVPTPVIGNQLQLTHDLFSGDALIWDRLESRSLHWGAPGHPLLRIHFPDAPWLGLWQKPGARYLCIEPWAGIADPVGFTGEVWDKPGIIRLAPSDSRTFRMAVTLEAGEGS